jgi:hypothetical protein
MHGVLSFMRKLNIDPANICFLPVARLRPEYEILKGRVYPLLFCGVARHTTRGVLVLSEKTARLDIRESGEPGGDDEIPIERLTARLCEMNALLYPVVHRRNALVRHPQRGYGCIIPTGADQYLDPENMAYRVHWASGDESGVDYLELAELLQPLGSHLLVTFRAPCLAELRAELSLPDGGSEDDSVFRCCLFYPNGEAGGDTDYHSVYINVSYCRRENGTLQKSMSEIYKVALTDLVAADDVKARGLRIANLLWVGV